MLIEEHQLPVSQLRPGMYVSRLDRDWTGTPYPLQGVLIESTQDIAELSRYCSSVTVDISKSESFVRGALAQARAGQGYQMPMLSQIGAHPRPLLSTMEEEIPRAGAALDNVHRAARQIVLELRSSGRLDEAAVGEAVIPVVDSIVRNPDAFFWLQALRQHDPYSYSHAVNCCGLMAAFGRHLGFPDEALRDLATGGLLLDIGKTAIPEMLLESGQALDEEQMGLIRSHPQHGVRLYEQSGAGNGAVRDMILTHHEREDGSGYAGALAGEQIPLFGRIAGIVDSYDAMTSARPYRQALPRDQALQALYRQRGTLYQTDLVEQFVQCLGTYPVGTLVELSTGEVAIVIAHNPLRRLFPRVMLLTETDKQPRARLEALDLRQTWSAYDSRQISIRRGLEPGSYGLDPTELYL